MGISIDAFNIICGMITIFAFLLATIQYYVDREFKRYMEKGLLSLIGLLDKAAAMGELDKFDKSALALLAESARDQTIGLLATFSKAQERLKTYNFGFTDEEIAAIVAKRKKALGLDVGGCIASGQYVDTPNGSVLVQDITDGSEIVCRDESGKNFVGSAWGISRHHVASILHINSALRLTGDHKVYTQDRGYVPAEQLKLGDRLADRMGNSMPVYSIERGHGAFEVHTLETTGQNLFVNGILIHNMPYK
jgi:hypothetical protein